MLVTDCISSTAITTRNMSCNNTYHYHYNNLFHKNDGANSDKVLVATLTANTTITTMHISDNHVASDGAKVLAKALTTNITITVIKIFNNNIIGNWARIFLQALAANATTITNINVI